MPFVLDRSGMELHLSGPNVLFSPVVETFGGFNLIWPLTQPFTEMGVAVRLASELNIASRAKILGQTVFPIEMFSATIQTRTGQHNGET